MWDSQRSTASINPGEEEIWSSGGIRLSLAFPVLASCDEDVSIDGRFTARQETFDLEGLKG